MSASATDNSARPPTLPPALGVIGTITGAADAAGIGLAARNTRTLSAGTFTLTRPKPSEVMSPPEPISSSNRVLGE